MCAPVALGVATAATGVIGAFGQQRAAADQARAANAANTQNYKYQLKMRERSWDRERYRYNNQVSNYENQLYENNSAAAKAYASEQRRVNEVFTQAAFNNQSQITQLLSSQGKMAAAGRSGKSADRIEGSLMAAYGRNQAIQAESLMSARQSYKTRTENIRDRLRQGNNDAFQQVAINPMPGVAPPQPVMQKGPSGFGLFTGILGAGLSGYGAYQQYKAPTTAIPSIPMIPTTPTPAPGTVQ